MIEMNYSKDRRVIILDKGKYKGFNYCIVNYGTHPCCYVFLPKNHKYYGKQYFDIPIECHWGLTFSDKDLIFNPLPNKKWVIGWDYAHCDDYTSFGLDFEGQKKWTTDELVEEVKEVIEQL